MDGYKCYRVNAIIELNIEEIVDEILRTYPDTSIEDITMDTMYEYVNDHITYIRGTREARGMKEVECGPSIEAFEERDYEKIEDELERIQKERTKPDIIQYSFDLRDPIDEVGLVKILQDAGVDVVGSSFQQRWTDKEYWRK